MLTKGYLSRRLDFDYKTPLSRAREDYILYQIEREEVDKIHHLRTLVEGQILANIRSSEAIDSALELLDNYRAFVLPYLKNGDRIKDKELTAESLAKIKEIHEKNKKAFEALRTVSKQPSEESEEVEVDE